MPRVVIDPRRPWRWDADGGAYVEEPAPPREAAAAAPADYMAQLITAMAATVKAVEAAAAPAVTFPPRCPHCGGVPTQTRTLMAERSGGGGMFGAPQPRVLALEIPSCARMATPLTAYFLQILLGFVTAVAALAILTTPYAALVAAGGLVASLALWRARTWIVLEPVVDGVVVLRVRDAAYAHGVARLSRGRVDGGRRLPPISDGDALRAPLPAARAIRGADDR